ncbi:MAG: hypothetical protein MZW92_30200 [Comamonadaceae bacterium]|nr:hypothetical protein [Comamonadaceae bacterium]
MSAPHDLERLPRPAASATARWRWSARRPRRTRRRRLQPDLQAPAQLAGSLIGGIRETQEMLDFCAAARHRLGHRDDPHGPDQRGLRAHAEERRAATASSSTWPASA